ncbi:hypothetical protein BC332_08562 [Capsicum chinense]|nr:hypothetical protein BC332_08562 [Capsicum chinense]
MESMFNEADVKVSFKNIEPTRKEISCFQISQKVVPAGVSHKDDEVNSDDDFQDPPHSKKYSITQKKHHGDSLSSPVKKKLKQQHKGLDEQTPKRTSPPRAAKKLSARTLIFMLIQQKEKVASKRKDINRSASKKSIPIESPDSFLCSFGDEDDFISKKVFHKFHNEVLQEMKFIRGLVSTRCDAIMNAISEIKVIEEINGNQRASLMEVYNEDKDDVLDKTDIDQHEARDICESPNTKLVDDNIGEAHISDTQFSFSDEVLRNINLDFIKSNLGVEDECTNNECDAEKIVDTSKDYQAEMNEKKSPKDDSKVLVDNHGLMSVLAVYRIDDDSLNAGRKEYHLNEYINGFRIHVTVPWHMVDHIFIPINVKAKHHWVLAVISFNDRCIYVYDSLSSVGHDAGVLAEVEKLAEVIPICLVAYLVSPVDCDPYLIHTRYASILWNYDMKKEEENAQSDDEAPRRPPREIGLTEDTEILEI